tara:strand:+ start:1212 stop:1799 length:588 start_codon:yes stop_codon:yes gene_type:complete
MINNIIVWGDGGHANMIKSIVIANYPKVKTHLVSKSEELDYLKLAQNRSSLSIIGVGDTNLRIKLLDRLNKFSIKWITLISKSAIISKNTKIGKGTVIMPGVILNNNVEIFSHCIINSGSIIEHDSKVGFNSFIGPGSVVAGNCTVADNVTINSSVTLAPNVIINDNIIVGASSFVKNNLIISGTYFGVPAKKKI